MKRVTFLAALAGCLGVAIAAKPESRTEKIRVPIDHGHCEADVEIIFDGGCIVSGVSEFLETDRGLESFDSMGSHFFDCGEEMDVCGKPKRCDCARPRDGGVASRRKKQNP